MSNELLVTAPSERFLPLARHAHHPAGTTILHRQGHHVHKRQQPAALQSAKGELKIILAVSLLEGVLMPRFP